MTFLLRGLKNSLKTAPFDMDGSISIFSVQQVRRLNWPDWKMLRDYNKRMCVKQYGADRDRINTIRKCDILPREIRDIADKEIVEKLPRNSAYGRLWTRCVISSRPRGVVPRWRLGRFVYRNLADYNKLSGVQRAVW